MPNSAAARDIAYYVHPQTNLRRHRPDHPLSAPRPEALRHRRAGASGATATTRATKSIRTPCAGCRGTARCARWTGRACWRRARFRREVNGYFVECYRRFVDLKCVLEAREHTAQVTSEDREEREERFRSGELPLLFCSPTMELGVDIAQLNLVNLRNVPPTPANYAQRSGRAGRGGQPALVYTYCAGRSPHDQYYFREPSRWSQGSVAPPRIDLRNSDLVRSHIHAIWMEVAKPDLGKTLTTVLDLTPQRWADFRCRSRTRSRGN